MSNQRTPKYNKRFSRKVGSKKLKKSNKKTGKRGKGPKRRNSRKNKDTKLTKRNWMKKLIFTGGDGSHQAEHVFGGIGQQHAASDNNNAIHQNGLPMNAPTPSEIPEPSASPEVTTN